MPRRPRTKLSPYQRLAVGFLSVVVLLAIGVLLLSVASVRVRITPRAESIAADVDVTIIGSGTPTEREVLGRLVRVDGTASVERVVGAPAAAGVTPVEPAAAPTSPVASALHGGAPARAEGTVTLVNTHTAPQPLVATTRLLSSDGALFRMKSGVTIPAKGKRDGVAVHADQQGAQGNIGPTKFTIPGLSTWLQARVWAESTAPMTGGDGLTVASTPVRAAPVRAPVPSSSKAVVREDDLVRVRAQATESAKVQAMQQATALTGEGEEIVPLDEVVRVTTTGAVGEVRDRVRAEAVVTMTAILVPKGAMVGRAQAALEGVAAASGRELLHVQPEKLRTRLVAQDPRTARATIAIHAEGDAVLKRGSLSFEPRRIAGFTAEEVSTYLRSIPGVADVEVHLRPFWVTRVPSSVGSVDVEVTGAEQAR